MNKQTCLFTEGFNYDDFDLNNKTYIGADPGADGSLVVLKGSLILEKHLVPKKTVKSTKPAKEKNGKNKKDANGRLIYNNKKIIDEEAYCDVIKGLKLRYPDACIVLEKVKSIGANPRQASVGATQNFSFGYNFGLINGFIIACNFRVFHLVTPQEWQKNILQLSDMIQGPEGKNDNKASSLRAFMRLFPHEDMRPSSRASKPHDGLVDAALIALYAKKLNL